jgi:hypothetical protein
MMLINNYALRMTLLGKFRKLPNMWCALCLQLANARDSPLRWEALELQGVVAGYDTIG